MITNIVEVYIHYPLPLEYGGPPDPQLLQATIRRLEAEIEKLQSTELNKDLQKRIEQLTLTNKRLLQENQRLANNSKGTKRLLAAIRTLESNVAEERVSFRAQLKKLRLENAALTAKVRQLSESAANRKPGDGSSSFRRRNTASPVAPHSSQSWHFNNRRSRSRSPAMSGRLKSSSLSRGSSVESLKSKASPRPRFSRSNNFGLKEIDFGKLETRIQTLQKMLKEGINLN